MEAIIILTKSTREVPPGSVFTSSLDIVERGLYKKIVSEDASPLDKNNPVVEISKSSEKKRAFLVFDEIDYSCATKIEGLKELIGSCTQVYLLHHSSDPSTLISLINVEPDKLSSFSSQHSPDDKILYSRLKHIPFENWDEWWGKITDYFLPSLEPELKFLHLCMTPASIKANLFDLDENGDFNWKLKWSTFLGNRTESKKKVVLLSKMIDNSSEYYSEILVSLRNDILSR